MSKDFKPAALQGRAKAQQEVETPINPVEVSETPEVVVDGQVTEQTPEPVVQPVTPEDTPVIIVPQSGTVEPVQQQPIFANPFVQALNDRYAAGASEEEIEQLWKVSRINVETLEPLQAIKWKYLLEHPELDVKTIDEALEEEYGDEYRTAAQKMKLQIATTDAKKFLTAQKDSMSTYREKRESDDRLKTEALSQQWQPVVNQLAAIPVSKFEVKSDKFNYDFSFNLPPEIRQQVAAATHQQLVASGVNPNDKETAAAIYNNIIRMATYQQQMEAVARDAYSKGLEDRQKQTAVIPGSSAPKHSPVSDPLAAMKQRDFKLK